jgi:hypothetical protein
LKASFLTALALALTTSVVAVPALARENPADYPMPAAAFQRRVDSRLQRAKTRLEALIAEQRLDEAQANELRSRFDAAAEEVEAEAQRACADGTVTLDEARAVRRMARRLRMLRRRGDV